MRPKLLTAELVERLVFNVELGLPLSSIGTSAARPTGIAGTIIE